MLEVVVLRGAQLSENCLHNLLNTKPLHFSEREQQYGLSNVNLSIVTIVDDIGVVKMVIDWECVT